MTSKSEAERQVDAARQSVDEANQQVANEQAEADARELEESRQAEINRVAQGQSRIPEGDPNEDTGDIHNT